MMEFPTDTLCPTCNTIFQQPKRKQGGGRRSIYCSHKCCALDWARGHGASRKASILKYDRSPENLEKKKERSLKSKFKKYGITDIVFSQQLQRQNYTCFGCEDAIDRHTARIDHDHTTGKFRGLLCNDCNWLLGRAYDNKEILYKLAAYLSYDRTKISGYIIGSLRNSQIVEIGQVLRQQGFFIWDEWISAGPEADDYFQKYHTALGMDMRTALRSEVAQHIFNFDKAHLDLCDFGVLLYPSGKSCHLEFGYMVGKNKKTFILLDKDPDRYEIMPQFATELCYPLPDLVEKVNAHYGKKI